VRKIIIKDMDGNSETAYMSDNEKELKTELANQKKQNLKEHLYMGYLIIGTIAFTLGIMISLKRLNGK
jgi:hypothetical protein